MKAIVLKKAANQPEMVIEDRVKPSFKSGYSLIKMKSVTVNQLSNTIRTGKFGDCPKDFILGNEGSGIVEESELYAPGDKVAIYGHNALGITEDGLFQEWALIENHRIIKLPDSLNFDEGSAFPVNYLTAYQAMKRLKDIDKSTFVLISGASGSVGHALIQVAKSLGAFPIALVSSKAKAEKAMAAGAFASINWQEEDVVNRVKELTHNKGADFGFDPVGGKLFEILFKSIKNKGQLISIGFTGGLLGNINLLDLISTEINIVGYSLFSESLEEIQEGLAGLKQLAQRSTLKPDIDSSYSFQDFEQAYQRLVSREAFGSITINFNN